MITEDFWMYIFNSLSYVLVMIPLGSILWTWLEDIDYVHQ